MVPMQIPLHNNNTTKNSLCLINLDKRYRTCQTQDSVSIMINIWVTNRFRSSVTTNNLVNKKPFVIPILSFIKAGILRAKFLSNKSLVWHLFQFIHKSFMIRDFFWGLVTHTSDWSLSPHSFLLLFRQPSFSGHGVGTPAVQKGCFILSKVHLSFLINAELFYQAWLKKCMQYNQ